MIPRYSRLDSRSRLDGIQRDPYHPPAATARESNDDCGDGLVCLPCSFDCTNDGRRCVAIDDLGVREGGTY
jgi:hypothetical protein